MGCIHVQLLLLNIVITDTACFLKYNYVAFMEKGCLCMLGRLLRGWGGGLSSQLLVIALNDFFFNLLIAFISCIHLFMAVLLAIRYCYFMAVDPFV